ncbi:MAG: zinc metalloprotease HtpX [SAR202 cluster bacterium Casp-Chloro-G4]|nr:zinc metalloprotease HtpX [Chloroflexota bacterium]PKB61929.1 MAG: zinc metalloprotease HtpX [SAR202 cluster bacterium Casp-Chloro-G4]
MRQRSYGRDTGLTVRMMFTMLMLGLVYVAFIGLLFAAGIDPFLILLLAAGMAFFQYFMSEKIVLAATRAKVVSAEEEPRLHATIERLAALADMPKPKKIAMMETHVPNAFATGRSPKHAVIAVTRGLMSRLNESELEAVLAHELMHVKNRDVMVLTWASLIVIAAGFLMQMLFWMSLFGGFGGMGGGMGGGRGRREGGGQAMMVMMAVYVGVIIIYFLSQLLIMALSRYREYAADRGGAIITGAPMQLASALQKISDDMYRIPEKDMRQVEHANAFFIIPALKGNSMASMFSSHPSVEKRIERLQNIQRQLER